MGLTPRRSLAGWHERSSDGIEEIGFGTGCGEGETHAAGGLNDAGGETWLARAERQDVRSEASWVLCSLIRRCRHCGTMCGKRLWRSASPISQKDISMTP